MVALEQIQQIGLGSQTDQLSIIPNKWQREQKRWQRDKGMAKAKKN